MIRLHARALMLAVLLTTCSFAGPFPDLAAEDNQAERVDATSLRGKVMCGYQGWFRCPGDAANLGWVHWSRNARRLTPGTLTFVGGLPATGGSLPRRPRGR